MAIQKLYKCSVKSCSYIFKNGKAGYFIHGRYVTSLPNEIEELESEVSLGHPNIYIDIKELEVDTEADPLAGIKAKLRQEILDEIRATELIAINPARDMGESEKGKFKPASTTDIAATSAGGDATQVVAKLASLMSTGVPKK